MGTYLGNRLLRLHLMLHLESSRRGTRGCGTLRSSKQVLTAGHLLVFVEDIMVLI